MVINKIWEIEDNNKNVSALRDIGKDGEEEENEYFPTVNEAIVYNVEVKARKKVKQRKEMKIKNGNNTQSTLKSNNDVINTKADVTRPIAYA